MEEVKHCWMKAFSFLFYFFINLSCYKAAMNRVCMPGNKTQTEDKVPTPPLRNLSSFMDLSKRDPIIMCPV